MVRKTVVLGMALLLVVSLSLLFLAQAKPEEPPPGVDPELWIPLAENFGVALSEQGRIVLPKGPAKPSFRELLKSEEELFGTLRIRIDGVWHKLYLDPPPVRAFPAK
jgi:hypothetical protein